MKKAIVYIRVSTDDQASEGHVSPEVQRNLCFGEAKAHNYKIIKIFKDLGYSGGTIKRPGLIAMLDKIKEDSTIEALFVQHTDRLARDTGIHTTIRNEFRKNNVEIFSSVQGGFIKDSPDGNLLDTVLAAINTHQREMVSYKTRESLLHKAKQGWLPTLAPLGYKNTEVKEEKIISIDSKKAPLIKELFRLYASGNYSAAQLSDLLYPKGLGSYYNKKIYPSKIYEILRNKFYIGELHYGDIHLTKANHKPIIDKKLFQAVQEMINFKNKYACRQRKHNFLLRGFIFCYVCGNRYTAEKHVKKGKSYYRCSGSACSAKSKFVPVNILEKLIEEKFKTIEFSTDFVNLVVNKVKLIYKKRREQVSSEKQILINKRRAVERKLEVIEDKLVNGTLSDKAFTRINQKYEVKIEKIDEEISDLEVVRKINTDEIKKILLLARNVYRAYTQADKEFKRYYLGFFWEKLEVMDRKIKLARPSKLFKAMLDLEKAYIREIKKPSPVIEKVSVKNSQNNNNQKININIFTGDPELVQLRTEMGG
jgi:DNA invertase Pin-like site-specific DNA recombinase